MSHLGESWRKVVPFEDRHQESAAVERRNQLPTLVARINDMREQLLKSEARMASWRARNTIMVSGFPHLRGNDIHDAERLRGEIAAMNKEHLQLLGQWHLLLEKFSQLKTENQNGGTTNGTRKL